MPASTFYNPLFGANSPGLAVVAFRFTANGTNAIDQSTIKGNKVTSVTYSATGVYTVVMDDNSYDVLYAHAYVDDLDTSDQARVQLRFSGTDGRANDPLTITIKAFSSGTTQAALAAGRVVSVLLICQKSAGA